MFVTPSVKTTFAPTLGVGLSTILVIAKSATAVGVVPALASSLPGVRSVSKPLTVATFR